MGPVGCCVALFVVVICPGNFSLFAEDAAGKPLEVETVLKNWHERISQYQGIQARLHRTIYDHVRKCRLQTESSVIATRDHAVMGGSEMLIPDKKAKTNGVFMVLEERAKGYDQKEIPLIRWIDSDSFYLPSDCIELELTRRFLLGIPPGEFQERYQISIEMQSEQQVWLKFLPQFEYDQKEFREAVLVLDLETYLPCALKMVSKRDETVYLFEDVRETTVFEPIPDPDRWSVSAWRRRWK